MQDTVFLITHSEFVFNYGPFLVWAEFLLGAWVVANLYVRRKLTRVDIVIVCIMVLMFFVPVFSWRIKF